jgi:hypothetical protein
VYLCSIEDLIRGAAAPPVGGLPTRLMSPWTSLTHHPSWVAVAATPERLVLTGRALQVPAMGRAGAASLQDQRSATDSYGQLRRRLPTCRLVA